ncbi:S-layer homology domain-containing protein [Acetivibrio saccincola]|uniref:S-layer homology domain-containing protein n=1 Tax=Acetivibrio saccincola TaxID=1677857 RepID=UPI003BFA69DB
MGEHKAYLSGYPDGLFRPNQNITRAEAAAIFARILGYNADSNLLIGNKYTDVDDSHWAAWAIKLTSDKGLFVGYPDGSFKPDQNITRAEFSTAVFKFLKLVRGISEVQFSEFTFEDAKGHWAENYIEQLTRLGYISGYPDGTFKPENKILRSETVALMNRALERGPLYGAPQIFEDVTEKHWAFYDIAEGALDHRYRIDEDKREVLVEILEK